MLGSRPAQKLSSDPPSPQGRQGSQNHGHEQSVCTHTNRKLERILFNSPQDEHLSEQSVRPSIERSPVLSPKPTTPPLSPSAEQATNNARLTNSLPNTQDRSQNHLDRPNNQDSQDNCTKGPIALPLTPYTTNSSHSPAINSASDTSPVNMASSNNFIPANAHRHMRACMICSIVKTQQQFHAHGCPNCEKFLDMAGNMDLIQEVTSQVFDGLITVSDTEKSWVARWQRLEGYVPGVYAVQVEGVLPEDVVAQAEEAGVHYIPRDGSVNEALPTDA